MKNIFLFISLFYSCTAFALINAPVPDPLNGAEVTLMRKNNPPGTKWGNPQNFFPDANTACNYFIPDAWAYDRIYGVVTATGLTAECHGVSPFPDGSTNDVVVNSVGLFQWCPDSTAPSGIRYAQASEKTSFCLPVVDPCPDDTWFLDTTAEKCWKPKTCTSGTAHGGSVVYGSISPVLQCIDGCLAVIHNARTATTINSTPTRPAGTVVVVGIWLEDGTQCSNAGTSFENITSPSTIPATPCDAACIQTSINEANSANSTTSTISGFPPVDCVAEPLFCEANGLNPPATSNTGTGTDTGTGTGTTTGTGTDTGTGTTTGTGTNTGTTTGCTGVDCPPASDFCAANPNASACATLGEAPIGEIPTAKTVDVSTNLDSMTFSGAGTCPPDHVISLHGGTVLRYSYKPFCDFLGTFRLVALSVAFFVAALILFGQKTSDNS